VVIFELSGRLGHAGAEALTAALSAAIDAEARRIVLDFAAVDYISSAGLLAVDLAAARLTALEGVLVLSALAEPVRLTFDLAGLLTRYPLAVSQEQAVARLRL
jgi:anti-anti-sigma factor